MSDPANVGPVRDNGDEQLGDAIDPREPSQKSILNIVAGILAVRSPTRLVVDGTLCLLMWLVLGTITGALRDDAWRAARGTQPSPLREPLYWLELLPSALYWIGLVLIAVGCCRVIADRVAAVPPRSGV